MPITTLDEIYADDPDGLRNILNESLFKLAALRKALTGSDGKSDPDVAALCHQLTFIAGCLGMNELKTMLFAMEKQQASGAPNGNNGYALLEHALLQQVGLAADAINDMLQSDRI